MPTLYFINNMLKEIIKIPNTFPVYFINKVLKETINN